MDYLKNNSPGFYFRKSIKGKDIFSYFSLFSSDDNALNAFRNQNILYFALLLTVWFSINVLQSIFTQIGNDEAYYWLYAKHLDWGYFDHPPMIALFIKLGGYLFKEELGVRIIVILSQLISLYFIWRIIDEKEITPNKLLIFFGVAASIPLFQIYGFIATPDAALLLFTTLFLFSIKRFLQEKSFANSIFLAISMAGLMYSKYHGGLVILLTLAANWKLLLDRRFWVAVVITFLLLIPHLIWQIENGFPTFQYQMVARMNSLRLSHFIQFWPNQLLAFNPIILVLLFATFHSNRSLSDFERTLTYIIIGIFSFFWLASFTARIEPHWTAAAAVPAIILLYKYVTGIKLHKRFVHWAILSSVFILLLTRFVLVFDILPFHLEFLHQKKWVNEIHNTAGELPVAFINSYQKASVYSFYSGNDAVALNNVYYRKNQFDLWDSEMNFHEKKAAILFEPKPSIKADNIIMVVDNYAMIVDTLYSFQKVRVDFSFDDKTIFRHNETISLPVVITNPYPYRLNFAKPGDEVTINAMFLHNKQWTITPGIPEQPLMTLMPGESKRFDLQFAVPPLAQNVYQFGISLRTPILLEAFNSRFQKIRVTSAASN